MADYDLFMIEITKNYTVNEWREDIKKVARLFFWLLKYQLNTAYNCQVLWYYLIMNKRLILIQEFGWLLYSERLWQYFFLIL